MDRRKPVGRLYRVREFAGLAGVTVRTLHHYDSVALLRPKRSESGYRLYGIRDLERLEQIVALKFLGLPLKQIKALLDREDRRLREVLRSQRRALEEKRRQLDRALEAIGDAERMIRPGGLADAAALRRIIEVIEMQDDPNSLTKYYSEAARAKISERQKEWTPALQEQVTREWTELFRDVEAALGEDPAGERAEALAARWKKLIEGFTGGDPEISAGLKRVWADQPNWPESLQQHAAPFRNPKILEFMGRVMNCGKK